MGKDGDLWDDSALINAFDSAMSKYKRMHGKKTSDANVSVVDQDGDDPIKCAEESSNATSSAATGTIEVKDLQPGKENINVDLEKLEPYVHSSTNPAMQHQQDPWKGYSDMQGTDDYNQLLSQYYEVEDKRQKILQQLQQFGSYQYPAEGSTVAQWGTSCNSQEYSVPTSHASHSTVTFSCCPYPCQSLVTPCTAYPCCSLDGTCTFKPSTEPNNAMAHGNLPTAMDCDIVKTAMGAAERAISSMTAEAATNPNVNEENKKAKDGNGEINQSTEGNGEINQGISCETNLSVLLNAWYSAGFYTGKYLVEQSMAKRRQ